MAEGTQVGSIYYDLDLDDSKFKGKTANASKEVKSFGETVATTFKTGGIAATGFLAAISGVGLAMTKVASDFEQNRISFEVMAGSVELGRKALTDLSNFAVKTPFELPQLLQASKSLMAYGVESNNLIPILQNLGDIASGVGMDKLPNLILAFGQVKAATKLTGMELRQFTEAGVPLLQLLVDQANKAGGSWVTVGGSAKKTKVDVAEMNDKLAIASQRLKEAEGNAKTKTSTLMSLRNTVQNYNQKLGEANKTGGEATKVWQKQTVTVAQMKDMISDGVVTFEQVQKALQSATGEGGKFFNLMELQSKTFGGTMSNLKDQLTRTLAEIAGIDIANGGIIREGSIFAVLKMGAEGALDAINRFTPIFVGFVQKLIASKEAMIVIGGAIGGALVLAFGALILLVGQGVLILTAFMAVGAGIAYVVNQLIEGMGGWEAVLARLQPIISFIGNFFTVVFLPILQAIWNNLTTGLIPALKDLWQVLEPILIPVLKFLAFVIGTVIVGALILFFEMINVAIQLITKMAQHVTEKIEIIKLYFTDLPEAIRRSLGSLYSAMVTPFEQAFNKIKQMAEEVWEKLQKINPFNRNSPSLVDNVTNGVAEIISQYSRLTSISMPQVSSLVPALSGVSSSNGVGTGVNQTFNTYIDKVGDMQDIQALSREIGFKASMTPR